MKKKFAVIQVLLILIFIGCAVYIGVYYYNAQIAQQGFDELKAVVEKKEQVDATYGYIDERAENGMLKQYYELYNKNTDMVGWLKIPNTIVDYPVVRYTDNEYYLHKNFDKKYQYSGIPFLDYQNTDESMNLIIYAHNMKSGSMFAVLTDFEDKKFYDTHKEILYDTLYDKGKYEIISAFTTKVGEKNEFKYYEYADMETEEQFNEYIKTAQSLSFYDTDTTAQFGDKLITLSTCAYHTSNERFVVIGKKVS